MSVRNKSRRRLFILLIVAVASVTALGGAYGGVKLYKKHKARIAGDEGVIAFNAGDHRLALEKLGAYLGRFPTSTDDTYAQRLTMYATARESVEEANGSHLTGALDAWRKLAEVRPGNLEARRKILKLYPVQGQRMLVEANEAADSILRELPKDREALFAKAVIQFHMRKLDDSRKAAEAVLALDPLDLDAQFLMIDIMLASAQTPQQILAYTQRQPSPPAAGPEGGRGVDPKDPRYLLVKARGHYIANNVEQGDVALLEAAKADVKELGWLRQIVRMLDSREQFDVSLALCQKAAEQNLASRDFQEFYILRQFDAGNYGEVLNRLAQTKPENPGANGLMLALKAWSLVAQHQATPEQAAEARTIVDQLLSRVTTDRVGFGFGSAMRAAWPQHFGDRDKPAAAADRVNDARQALASQPGNYYLRFLVGEVLSDTDDTQAAFEQYRVIRDQVQAWGLPRIRAGHMLYRLGASDFRASGMSADAVTLAEEGLARAPGNGEGQVVRLLAKVLNLAYREEVARAQGQPPPAGAAAERGELLAQCQKLEQAFPSFQELWPAHVELLARLDRRDEAIAVLRQQLGKAPSRDTYLALGSASTRLKLGVEEEVFDACEKAHGLSPELAGSRAIWMYNAGKQADGLAYIRKASEGKKESLWGILTARYLELLKDPSAKAQWIRIGETYPEDLRVQRSVLSSPLVQADHKLQGEVLARIRKSGEPGPDTQFIYAQWLIAEWQLANNGKPEAQRNDEQLVEAAKVLTALTQSQAAPPDVRLLLAECMQKLKNTSGAIEQLRAVTAVTDSILPHMQLARLELARGNAMEARQQVERLTSTLLQDPVRLKARLGQLTLRDRLEVIEFLRKYGDPARAILVAEAAGDAPEVALSLVGMYAQAGQMEKSEKLLASLLEKPTPAAVEFAIAFYPTIGRGAESAAALARLDAIDPPPPPGAKEVVQARYHAINGNLPKAIELYLVAARSKPPADASAAKMAENARPRIWRQLLALTYAMGQRKEFAQHLAEAHKELPGDAAIAAIHANLRTIEAIPPGMPEGQMLVSMLRDADEALPESLQFIQEVLAVREANKARAPQTAAEVAEFQEREEKLLARLQALAEKYSGNFALQKCAVDYALSYRNYDDAVLLANRATQTQPNAPSSWELAVRAYLSAGRLDEASRTAQEWRKRLGARPMEADVAFAAASLAAGRLDAGLQALEPYVVPAQQALAAGNATAGQAELLVLYCKGLMVRNQPDRANAILEPLLKGSVDWRGLYMDLATQISDPATGEAWINRAAELIDKDSTLEQGRVAIAWNNLGGRTRNAAHQARALAIVDALVPREKVEAPTLFFAGMLYEASGREADAEKLYRRLAGMTVETEADRLAQARAFNNLAMMLSRRPGGATEAMTIGARPLEMFPRDPNFYDTYAQVCAAAKQWDRALAGIEKAITLNPQNPEWRVTKLWLLSQAGKKDQLQAVYNTISASDRDRLAPDVKKRLESIQIQ